MISIGAIILVGLALIVILAVLRGIIKIILSFIAIFILLALIGMACSVFI